MLEGRCLCGAVRYRSRKERLFELICCCDDCQRATGSGHMPAIGVPRSGFEVEGETRSFARETIKGIVTRDFCPTCGSPLFGVVKRVPQLVWFYAGSQEPPKSFSPTMAVHVREKCAWDLLPDGLHLWPARFGDADVPPLDGHGHGMDGVGSLQPPDPRARRAKPDHGE